MKNAKRFFVITLTLVIALSCMSIPALAAPGDGGENQGGPSRVDQSVEVKAGDKFAYGEIILTVNNDAATAYTLTKGDVRVDCTGKCENVENGTMQGIYTLTQVTVDESSDVNSVMPSIWSDKRTVILNRDHTFSPDLDLDKAVVAFTSETKANADSKTGYTTTITVDDPGKSYSSVWAYGNWMASKTRTDDGKVGTAEADYDTKLYEPEDWENGMYYAGNGAREMTYDASSGKWTLSLDLASAIMSVGCYRDVTAGDFTDSISPKEQLYLPYDDEKQSKSFDWTVVFENEKAGTVTTVELNDVVYPFTDNEGSNTGSVKLAIYTPYGYDANDTTTSYPVLYLIAGMQASYDSWFTGGRANYLFDNLIADGKIAPTIVVAMERNTARMDAYDVWEQADDRSKSNGDGDGYINYVDGTEKGSGTENMIDSVTVSAVVPYIDANYNTVSDAEHRGIVGVSMGGVAATQIWMTANDEFNFYGFFSGADMWFKDQATDQNVSEYYWGLRHIYTNDYTVLLNNAMAAEGKVIVTGGGITDRNAFGGDQNSAGADNVNAFLAANGVDHVYDIVGGAHDWETWTKLLKLFTDELASKDSTWQVKKTLFIDVKQGEWYEDAIQYVCDNGIMTGVGESRFAPDKYITCTETWTMLARLDGKDTSVGETWSSIGESWAKANGISDGTNPGSDITREQLATMLWQYSGSPTAEAITGYNDVDSVSDFAEDAMAWAVEKGVINGIGNNTLNPQGAVTRAEAATMFMRYMSKA